MNPKIWLWGAAIAFLWGCAGPQISHTQLSGLDKGMAIDKVNTRLQQQPLSTHTGIAGDRTFVFHRFNLNNGMQSDLYLLAYEQDRLLYWGYVSEFRRQPDAAMNAALTNVLPKITAAR